MTMQRRDLLAASAALAGLGISLPVPAAHAASRIAHLGSPQRFDYAGLKGRARLMAQSPHVPSIAKLPPEIDKLTWDQYQAISPNADHALWTDDELRFRLRFFHLGLFFKTPVRLHELAGGMAQQIAYDPGLFNYGKSGLHPSRLPKDLGFAGFRINYHTNWISDVAAFLGASYFRAVGGEGQYGLSARGLAIDSGISGKPEEFPLFTDFWFEKPPAGSALLTVYALMDSPSVAGAYRFDIRPGDTLTMDVDAALYPRRTVERLGIAPLTSMFQAGENDKRRANDWRTEIHDSDGLSIWTGHGEWIWRPVTNPSGVRYSAFSDESPRGFGLLQRDRNFDHYQDDGVFYEKRPCLWVEPKGNWGKGSVTLIELPTDDETNDNTVAFWTPVQNLVAGEERLFSYRLHWGARPPEEPRLAHVVATRTGIGGLVGQPRSYFSWRFAIDLAGGDLAMLPGEAKVDAQITASRGAIEITSARPLNSIAGRRVMFDLKPTDASVQPIDLRMVLRYQGQVMSETWVYQWTPPPVAERKAQTNG